MWGRARRKCCFHVDRTYLILSVYVCDLECMSQSSSMIYTQTLKHVWSYWRRGNAFLKLNSKVSKRLNPSLHLPSCPFLFLSHSGYICSLVLRFLPLVWLSHAFIYLLSFCILLFRFFSSHPQFPVLCSLSHILLLFRSSIFFFSQSLFINSWSVIGMGRVAY